MCDKDKSKNLITVNSVCSVIQLIGDNTVDFLNNLLISNLLELENNNFQYTALCNPKGRIIASMWINIVGNNYVELICPKNLSNDLLDFFNMRKFRLKISITQTQDNVALDLDNNSIFISKSTSGNISNDESIDSQQYFYEFMFAQNIPWIDAENTEKFIPQHVNLDQHESIMSFSKGCYPGQEIIARIKYLGKIKKRMQLITHQDKKILEDETLDLVLVSPIIKNPIIERYSRQVINRGAFNNEKKL